VGHQFKALVIAILLTCSAAQSDPIINTVAGNGTADFSGDEGPAVDATLNEPVRLTLDHAGNVYFSDRRNHRIRKINVLTGVITTVAGNGSDNFSGDGGPAVDAGVPSPSDVVLDAAGNLYISSYFRVRRVSATTGLITTFAGTGPPPYGAPTFAGDGGPATSAVVDANGLAIDSAQDLFIADYTNHRIRKVSAETGIIETVAGNGSASVGCALGGSTAVDSSLPYPDDVLIDGDGNILVTEIFCNRIRRIDTQTWEVKTIAGNGTGGFAGDGGLATDASITTSYSIAVDRAGNVYIADGYSNRIRMVSAETGVIDTVVGSGDAGWFNGTYGGDGGFATDAYLNYPLGVAVDAANNLYVADSRNNRVRKVTDIVPEPVGILQSLTLGTAEVAGCKSLTAKVTLSGPAPPEGVVITLSDTMVAASTPATLKLLSGATTKKFTIKTTPVSVEEAGLVSATLGSETLSQPLTVRPMGLHSVTLTPTSVIGSQPVSGMAKLECNAGPGPITVDLSSNNAVVADPVAASLVVPQGLRSANFDVATNAVQTKSYATIAGTANGITKSKKLTVNVAAAVSPTSLKFGSVSVGQSSATLNATLTNRGTVPFSVNSISLTGTAASWFAQTNNCPASLEPGVACTVSVTFKPISAASKSAKLSIATGATATPLSVSLSGTGVLPP
jgi:hypothetical protein